MKTFSFLGTAEARADHLRELSTHLRALDLTSASLSEAEHEVPELELALTVFNRLAPDGDRAAADEGFVTVAEERAEHLRTISHHMRSLDLTKATLAEVDDEIPELDIAMTVYRRLTGQADAAFATESAEPATEPRATPHWSIVEDPTAEPAPATSFSQFARQHLDPSPAEFGADSTSNAR